MTGVIKRRTKEKISLFFANLILTALCILVMIPILYAFSVSLNAQNSLLSSNFSFIPKEFTFNHYKAVFLEKPIIRWFINSMILATATVTISLSTGIPAAYVFSRKKFAGRKAVLQVLVLLYAFPSLLSMTALYKLLTPMGLLNTRTGLIVVYTGTMAVFALWNMKGYFDTIPSEIEEAARIDGTNNYQLVTKIVLPLAKPTIVVTAMMVLIFVWNEYIFAINFMTGTNTYTLAAGLYSLQATEMSGSWPLFSAASLMVSLPILIIFFALQKNMRTGLTSGGVKG